MSSLRIPRRDFFKKASVFTATAAAFGFGERLLPACHRSGRQPAPAPPEIMAGPLPFGKLGNLKVSRLIGGHGLVCFQAQDGEGLFARQLQQAHVTDEKILATFDLCERVGINTAFLRITDQMVKVAERYVTERGGKLQWIAQLVVDQRDPARDIDVAMKLGVHAAFLRGVDADRYAPRQMDILAKGIERVRNCRIPIGLGGHNIETIIAAETAGLPVDFYMKTFNNARTSMSGENSPGETAEFFAKIGKPWIALKVLGPGRISTRDGFKHAFADGADFVAASMFDFQLAEDARFVKELLAGKLERARPWRA